MVRAEYYLQNGNKNKAIQEIEFGMDTFRPVTSEILAFLMKIKEDEGEKNSYNELKKRYKITSVLEAL